MSDLLDILLSYNRKERFILMTQVAAGDSQLRVSPHFRQKLEDVLALPVPDEVPLMAMDFHLNWLYGGLWEAAGGDISRDIDVPEVLPVGADGKRRWAIGPNQEDIDLLLGWRDESEVHLVLVEAKVHSGWSGGQMTSKARRLQSILYGNTDVSEFVRQRLRVHLVLAGLNPPSKPEKFRENWPDDVRALNNTAEREMLFIHLAPATTILRRVGRHDGIKSIQTAAWRVLTEAAPSDSAEYLTGGPRSG